MCGFDRSTITGFGRELRQQNVQCLDWTDHPLRVFGRELRQQNAQCVDLTDQRFGFWQGVAATKCSMSGFDRYND